LREQGDDRMSFDWPRRGAERARTDLPAAEFRRLGKPGAYRLGLLRKQGVPGQRPQAVFRARFSRRRDHRWRVAVCLLGLLACVFVIAAGTAAGLVFLPLLAGLAAGVANRSGTWPPRIMLPAVAGTAAAGWVLPFLLGSWHGSPGGPLAHDVATLTGQPATAAGVVALTALIAVVQGLAGYFLASVITSLLQDDQARRG
jgi:hypothetical protein